MNKLSREARAQILGMMAEGMSLRAIARMSGASKNTIVKLLEALERIEQFARNPPPTSATEKHVLVMIAAMAEEAIREAKEGS